MRRQGEPEPATSAFEAVVEAGGERIADLMDRCERQLRAACSGYGETVADYAAGTLAAGGKRVRPLLVFLCGIPAHGDDLVRAAAAVELVHMATLVHDDAIDAAPLRRGQPTVFARAGTEAAIATGDFLLARALGLLAENGAADQTDELAQACLALARGELAQRRDAYANEVTLDRYLERCQLKTASLFSAACVLGALTAGRSTAEAELLSRYGGKVGLAFQLLDDVLDVSGPAERTGKRRGTDLLEGTTTLPLILAREDDTSLASLDLSALTDADAAEAVCDRIAATGALERARAVATRLANEGKREAVAVDAPLALALATVADGIVERYA